MKRFLIALVVIVPAFDATAIEELSYRTEVDLPITLGLGAAWITSEILKEKLAPPTCRWCDPPGIDRGFNVSWNDIERANTASDIVGFYTLPVVALGLDWGLAALSGDAKAAGIDALLVLESITITSVLTQITKFSVGRKRPFENTKHPEDNNLSFFSGHTSLAFAVAVSASTTMSLRRYDYAWVGWVTLLPAAISVAYLRMAADRHYFTDVLFGALVGSTVGFVVPWLHRPGVGVAAGSSTSRNHTPILLISFQF